MPCKLAGKLDRDKILTPLFHRAGKDHVQGNGCAPRAHAGILEPSVPGERRPSSASPSSYRTIPSFFSSRSGRTPAIRIISRWNHDAETLCACPQGFALNDFGSRVSVLFSVFSPKGLHAISTPFLWRGRGSEVRTFFRRLRAPISRANFGPVCLGVIVSTRLAAAPQRRPGPRAR